MRRPRPVGFTLVEMAVVLVIVGLLMSMLMGPISQTLENQRVKEAKQVISETKAAILGFMLRNKRLPCPAKPDGDGKEDCTLANTGTYGVVPWLDLGMPQLDPWGHRYRYAVATGFAKKDPLVATSCTQAEAVGVPFTWCTLADLNIKGAEGSGDVATNVAVIILSHGKNGLGGFGSDGKIKGVASSGNELENTDDNTTFRLMTMDDSDSSKSTFFDDVVDWIASPVIFNRMVEAKQLP